MGVTKCHNQVCRAHPYQIRHIYQKSRKRRDVKWHPQHQVRTSLVYRQGQGSVFRKELVQIVARCQHHLAQLTWTPETEDVSATVRVFFQPIYQRLELINSLTRIIRITTLVLSTGVSHLESVNRTAVVFAILKPEFI